MEHYKRALLQKYATFTGRDSRAQFWYFVLFNIVISIILSIVEGMLGLRSRGGSGILSGLYNLALVIPSIAATTRRLHDTNRSGWWWLIGLIPIVGWIVLIVLLVGDSTPGDNQYGSNPNTSPAVPVAAATPPTQPPTPPTTPTAPTV